MELIGRILLFLESAQTSSLPEIKSSPKYDCKGQITIHSLLEVPQNSSHKPKTKDLLSLYSLNLISFEALPLALGISLSHSTPSEHGFQSAPIFSAPELSITAGGVMRKRPHRKNCTFQHLMPGITLKPTRSFALVAINQRFCIIN